MSKQILSRNKAKDGLLVWLAFFSKAFDIFLIAIILYVVVDFYRPGAWDIQFTVVALIGAILFPLVAEILGIYHTWWNKPIRAQYSRVLAAWCAVLFALLAAGYFFKVSASFSRLSVGVWMLSTPVLLVLWRHTARFILLKAIAEYTPKLRAVIWGDGSQGRALKASLEGSVGLGIEVVDYIESGSAPMTDAALPIKMDLDLRLKTLIGQAASGEVDVIYIAVSTTARERITHLIDQLSDTTVSVYMVPDYFTTQLFHGEWDEINGMPVISVFKTPFWGIEGGLKRIQDLVFASIILLVIAIPMLLLAAAVKMTSPGPVFFKQHRYGMDGKKILVLKFRSMKVMDDGDVVKQATKDDPRVTRLGRFMRKTSLDELPQFINVLRGDMSVVGPRPHAVAHNEEYRKLIKGYMLRHKVKPGITGWAQINGWRGETEDLYKMQKRVEFDLWYIRNWSFWLDLKIIFQTLVKGFVGNSAY